ncbi:MAG: GNAT family N-acyltransferase [Bryobacteraceae bacterium]
MPKSTVSWEVDRLPPQSVLLRQGVFDVLLARSWEIPALLLEVGRVRELAFRMVGEGTGRRCDVDAFDEYYEHLILWDRERREVAGGYRLARVAPTVARLGVRGLYTATLFHFTPALFSSLGPSLELGRSFVHPEYQRKPHSLLLLWKGIGRYLERHPECRVLFGPVSISGGFSQEARIELTDYLRREVAADETLRRHVRARRPPKSRWLLSQRPAMEERSLDKIDELVRSVGGPAAERGIPVLLRQYLKLGGRVLACSTDKSFGGCLDALMVVDLRRADRSRLDRMLGTSLSTGIGDSFGASRTRHFDNAAVGVV